MQVSESASSALTRELVMYASIRGHIDKEADELTETQWLSSRIASVQSLKAQGVMVGLRLAERLLYREPAFGGSPLEIARFVGSTLWRAIFGKKVDSIKAINNTYSLNDVDFRWLQGYAKVTGRSEVNSLALDEPAGKDSGFGDNGVDDPYVGHKDVLTYTVGIIEGSIETLFSGGNVSVRGIFTAEGEAQFILKFNES